MVNTSKTHQGTTHYIIKLVLGMVTSGVCRVNQHCDNLQDMPCYHENSRWGREEGGKVILALGIAKGWFLADINQVETDALH